MKIPGIVIAASMLTAANADPRRLRKEFMRRLQPDAPPVETSQGEYIEVGADPTVPAFQAKAEKSMSMGAVRDFDPKADKVSSMRLVADSGSVGSVKTKADKVPGGSMSPVAVGPGSMRDVEAKAEKTLADRGSMSSFDAKAQKQQPGSMSPDHAGSMRSKAEKTPPDGSMRLAESTAAPKPDAKARKVPPGSMSGFAPAPKAEKTESMSLDTKAQKNAAGGSMSTPVEKESAFKVFSKASL
ncbi:hypothetical protein ACHAW6_007661 [Cyclotella cf. meneghiniana]